MGSLWWVYLCSTCFHTGPWTGSCTAGKEAEETSECVYLLADSAGYCVVLEEVKPPATCAFCFTPHGLATQMRLKMTAHLLNAQKEARPLTIIFLPHLMCFKCQLKECTHIPCIS